MLLQLLDPNIKLFDLFVSINIFWFKLITIEQIYI